MKALVALIALLLICAAQNSIAFFMSITSIKPDFVLIFVVLMGLVYGQKVGLAVGFFAGLIIDLSGTGIFGFYTFSFVIIGTFAGSFQKSVFEDNFLLPLMFVFFSTFITQILWYICAWLADYRLTSIAMIILFVFAKSLYNLILTAPMYFVFRRVSKILNR